MQKPDLVAPMGFRPLYLGKKSKMINEYSYEVAVVDIMMLT